MEPPSLRNPIRALVALLVLGSAPPLSAVPPEGSALAAPGLEVPGLEVPLVQLDVVVHDTRGEPVTDLGRDDFALFQEKNPVPLAGFSPPETAGGEEDAAAADRPPLHLVLCIHLQFLESGDLVGLRESLAGFLRDGLPGDARILLARINPELAIVEGFTTDRERLLARVDELVTQQGVSRLNTEYASILREIREQARKPLRESGSEVRDAIPKALLTRIGGVAEQAYREMGMATAWLARLMIPLAGLPGRKEVLLVSGRLPAQAGSSLLSAWQRAFDRTSAYWGDGRADPNPGIEFDSLPEAATFLDTGRQIQELTSFASARGVTIHTLDVSSGRANRVADGQSDPTGQDSRAAARRTLGDRQTLSTLAESTGGRALPGGELAEAFGVLARELRSRYTLAFEPPQGADGALHEILVRLPEHRRLKTRHALSYRARSRDQETADLLLSAFLLDPHGGAPASNPLAAEVEPVAAAGPEAAEQEPARGDPNDPKGRIRVAVRVPLASLALIPQGHSHLGQISVFSAVGAAGEGDSMPPVAKAVVPVRIANDELLTSQGRQVEYFLELPWRPGLRRLVVAVRDDFQTVTSMLVVPLGGPAKRAAISGGSVAGP